MLKRRLDDNPTQHPIIVFFDMKVWQLAFIPIRSTCMYSGSVVQHMQEINSVFTDPSQIIAPANIMPVSYWKSIVDDEYGYGRDPMFLVQRYFYY